MKISGAKVTKFTRADSTSHRTCRSNSISIKTSQKHKKWGHVTSKLTVKMIPNYRAEEWTEVKIQ